MPRRTSCATSARRRPKRRSRRPGSNKKDIDTLSPGAGWRAALAAALAFPAFAFALAQAGDSSARIVQYERADREQFLAQGAKKEGEVAVYTSLIAEDLAALSAAFERKYGVK